MLSNFVPAVFLPALLFSALATATNVDKRSVGALTPLSAKTTICNVLNYGGKADNITDIGPAITSAFTKCAKAGGATIYIPPGSYLLKTGVVLSGGSGYAIQIDGLITMTSDGNFGGNAIVIEKSSDVEMFSSNALGAINGQGYIMRLTASGQNARLVRFITVTDLSVHDLILIDSPFFHLIFNDVSNLEAYHITIRGADKGATDGVDLSCTDNCYLHHVEVTNRDECISVKSPSQNVLIEEIYCNQSGGMSIGSLTANDVTSTTESQVSNITMRNIYDYQCTQALMIKTFPGGSGATGYVKDSVFENFWIYDTTYSLDIDQYWESNTTPDTGAVALSGLTFNNWTGTVNNGVERGPIVIRGSDIVPITNIKLTNFDMWTVNGAKVLNQCKNVYGTGYCAQAERADGVLTTFTTTVTSTAAPAGFTSPTKPAWGVAGYGTTIPIPVYTPAVFWSPVSSGVVSTAASSASILITAKSTATMVSSSGIISSGKVSTAILKLSTSTPKSSTSAITSQTKITTKTSKSSIATPKESSSVALPTTDTITRPKISVKATSPAFVTVTHTRISAVHTAGHKSKHPHD